MMQQETRLAIARVMERENLHIRLCKGGEFLCPEAERLWRRACALCGTDGFKSARRQYDEHDPHLWEVLTHRSLPI